jgi:hypothetical protein
MAVTAHTPALQSFGVGVGVVWLSDTIKIMLCTSSYAYNQATNKYLTSVTNEVSGTGYTAGGQTLTGKTAVLSGGVYTFDAADVTWPNSTITARIAVVYKDTGSASTSPIIAILDAGQDVVSSGANGLFSVTFDPAGIYTVTAS